MHYGPYAFSKNGKKTITQKKSGSGTIGQRAGFSDKDIRKIQKLYRCDTGGGGGATTVRSITATKNPGGSSECKNEIIGCWFLKYFNSVCRHPTEKLKCRKTCHICDEDKETPKVCPDQHQKCKAWAELGYCKHENNGGAASTANLNYMRRRCPGACGFSC